MIVFETAVPYVVQAGLDSAASAFQVPGLLKGMHHLGLFFSELECMIQGLTLIWGKFSVIVCFFFSSFVNLYFAFVCSFLITFGFSVHFCLLSKFEISVRMFSSSDC